MAEPIRKTKTVLTYSDYTSWNDDKRYEIIEGNSYSMAPAPGERHQSASTQLLTEFALYLKEKKCKVYHAPFDVALPESGEIFETATNVIQPDLVIICDKNKILPRGCFGAPDLIVEILSPSSTKRDTKIKRKLYQRFGVKEYWIADPVHKSIQIFKLNKDCRYDFPEIYAEDDKIKVGLFNNELEIDLKVIFAE